MTIAVLQLIKSHSTTGKVVAKLSFQNPRTLEPLLSLIERSFTAKDLLLVRSHWRRALSWPWLGRSAWRSLRFWSWGWLRRRIARWWSGGRVVRAEQGYVRGTDQHFARNCGRIASILLLILLLILILLWPIFAFDQEKRSKPLFDWHGDQDDDEHYIPIYLFSVILRCRTENRRCAPIYCKCFKWCSIKSTLRESWFAKGTSWGRVGSIRMQSK